MSWIKDSISEWLTDGLVDAVMQRFESINGQIGDIAVNVGKTPQNWNVYCRG